MSTTARQHHGSVLGIGPRVETDPHYPKRVNVEFVQVLSPREVRQRTWERGSGETLACGTGASAVCVAGVLAGRTERRLPIHLLGGDLELEWRHFPHGAAQGEAVLSGKLEISWWADIVQGRLISQKQPVHPIIMIEGYQNFCINVRPNSPIRNVVDLQGKTIGTVLGTVFHGVIVSLLRSELGTADLKKLGINLINIPSVAQLMTMPTGIDAASNNIIFTLKGEMEGMSKPLADAHGMTGNYYKGPAGEGAGHVLPGFKKAPFYPEAYYAFRGYHFVGKKLIDEHPKLIKAFIMATEEAVRKVKQISGFRRNDGRAVFGVPLGGAGCAAAPDAG